VIFQKIILRHSRSPKFFSKIPKGLSQKHLPAECGPKVIGNFCTEKKNFLSNFVTTLSQKTSSGRVRTDGYRQFFFAQKKIFFQILLQHLAKKTSSGRVRTDGYRQFFFCTEKIFSFKFITTLSQKHLPAECGQKVSSNFWHKKQIFFKFYYYT
jgi:hypothetical protein